MPPSCDCGLSVSCCHGLFGPPVMMRTSIATVCAASDPCMLCPGLIVVRTVQVLKQMGGAGALQGLLKQMEASGMK